MKNAKLAFWTIAGLATSSSGVYAQTAPTTPSATSDTSGALQEVVVTAERRSENIQTVPIAITAFTADTLQQRNLTSVNALGNLTPGVNLDAGAPFSGDRSVLSASIRGVGQDDFAFNLNPAVGVYLDGVYLARTIGANQNLLDVDRVEILKGPQGTLFGANTEGGAISIITHTPGNEEKFTAQVTGGSLNRRDFGFTADLPIIKDTLLSSITVSIAESRWLPEGHPVSERHAAWAPTPFVVDPQDAYPKAGYQTGDAYGGYDVQTIRGKLLWLASDKMTVTLAADLNHQAQEALPYTVLGTYQGNLTTFDLLDPVQHLYQQQRRHHQREHPERIGGCPGCLCDFRSAPPRMQDLRACARIPGHTFRGCPRAVRRCWVRATSVARPDPSMRPMYADRIRPPTWVPTARGCTTRRGEQDRQHRHHLCQRPGLREQQLFRFLADRRCTSSTTTCP